MKKLPGRAASVFGAIVVLVIVGLAARSCSPSRTVGHGAVEEACFTLWQAVGTPNSATAHRLVERAQEAASRSQDRVLAADVSRVSKMYPGKGTGVALSQQVLTETLAECKAQGWKVTDPCTYGVAVCGRTVGVTTVTS
jgi:predicted GNAT family acetyltransferase